MQLYISPTSPYARKARIVVLEKGLAEQVQITPVNPWESPVELTARNPLSQVPVLVLDNGETLYDSRVICAYLDELNTTPRLVPAGGFERILVMRMEALADGMTDTAVNVLLARRDNEGKPDTPAIERQLGKILAALRVMEEGVSGLSGQFNLGTIAYGTALSYLDLRYGELEWRARAPELAKWFKDVDNRPVMIETRPVV